MNLAQAGLTSGLPTHIPSLVSQVSDLVRRVAAREIMPRYL